MLRFSMRQPDETLCGALSAEICRALTTLFEPEAVVELRVLETDRGERSPTSEDRWSSLEASVNK
jgi:hypothetical protein